MASHRSCKSENTVINNFKTKLNVQGCNEKERLETEKEILLP